MAFFTHFEVFDFFHVFYAADSSSKTKKGESGIFGTSEKKLFSSFSMSRKDLKF